MGIVNSLLLENKGLERKVMKIIEWFGHLFERDATGQQGGGWTPEAHLANSFFDEGLAETLYSTFSGRRCKSVIDLGCGLGRYLSAFKESAETVGVEPNDMGSYFGGSRQIIAPLPDLPKEEIKPYHLVMCMEIAEHIPEERHDELFDLIKDLCAHRGWLVFSGAHMWQVGRGHIANRPQSEWRAGLEARGFLFDEEKTKALRKASKYFWFRANLMVFQHREAGAS